MASGLRYAVQPPSSVLWSPQRTNPDMINAYRNASATFNAGAGPASNARAVLLFYVGAGGHSLKQSEAGGAPDIVVGEFKENMNEVCWSREVMARQRVRNFNVRVRGRGSQGPSWLPRNWGCVDWAIRICHALACVLEWRLM